MDSCLARTSPLPAAQTERESPVEGATAEPTGWRILLAEDNAVNQTLATLILTRAGYEVDVVGNGLRVLDALRTGHYDLILMDIQMPVMDGIEATRIIRDPISSVYSPTVPIIALTARAMDGDREQCLREGMNGYIAKPFRAKALLHEVEAMLGSAPGPETATDAARPAAAPEGEAVIDRASALALLDGDADLLVDLWRTFSERSPSELGALRAAHEAGDRATVRRLAHSLKSASGSIGAPALGRAAAALEGAAAAPGAGGLDALVGNLLVEFDKVLHGLREMLPQP
jgi:CheY-like chemotaxis protein